METISGITPVLNSNMLPPPCLWQCLKYPEREALVYSESVHTLLRATRSSFRNVNRDHTQAILSSAFCRGGEWESGISPSCSEGRVCLVKKLLSYVQLFMTLWTASDSFCPWDFPSKDAGVLPFPLLQFPNQGLNSGWQPSLQAGSLPSRATKSGHQEDPQIKIFIFGA